MNTEPRDEFCGYLLNSAGAAKCREIGLAFSDCLTRIEAAGVRGRELALVVTKLQEASSFAKRGVCADPTNRDPSMARQ